MGTAMGLQNKGSGSRFKAPMMTSKALQDRGLRCLLVAITLLIRFLCRRLSLRRGPAWGSVTAVRSELCLSLRPPRGMKEGGDGQVNF